MTKKLLNILTALIMVVSLVGVLPAVDVSASEPTVSYKSTKKSYPLKNGKICKVKFKRPIIKGNKKSYKKINKYFKKLQSRYVTKVLNFVNDYSETLYKENCYIDSIIKVKYKRGNIISFSESYSDYTGGVHGTYMVNGYTFNLKTSKKINIGKASKYKTKIKSKIVSKFKKETELEPERYYEDALQIVKEKKLKDFNYFLQGKYMYIVFNIYEVAPYVAGLKEIKIKIR